MLHHPISNPPPVSYRARMAVYNIPRTAMNYLAMITRDTRSPSANLGMQVATA